MTARDLAVVFAIASAACLRPTEYRCATSDQCTGTGGTCEPEGYCSIADTTCSSGRRFDPSAGQYAGQCVGAEPPVDSGMPDDAPPPPGCPASYRSLPSIAPHVYRVIATDESWNTHRMDCADDSPNAYLAIPDDAGELAAIAMASQASELWVGIHDQLTEGMFVNTKGQPQTFLPWDGGEPDDNGPSPGQDCVYVKTSGGTILTARCNEARVAVCECEP